MSKQVRLKIGILMAMYNSEYYTQLYGASQNYLKFMEQYGSVRIITPDQDPEEMGLDLLILPGGPDLSFAVQEDKGFKIGMGKDMPSYTYFYKNSLQKWIDAGVPMFGICLGAQGLANHFGANIITDGHGHQIRDEHPALRVEDREEVGVSTCLIDVNSRHHQFIDAEGFPEVLTPLVYGANHNSIFSVSKDEKASAKAKKLAYQLQEETGFTPSHIEAFRHATLPIAGVQWHPEDMLYGIIQHGDPTTHSIIEWLLSFHANHTNVVLEPTTDSEFA